MKKLYLAVTPDRFEFPIIITDTPTEMAKIYGISLNNLLSMIAHKTSGKKSGVKFVRVLMDDGEE